MKVILVDKFTRESVEADKNNAYLFGDNIEDRFKQYIPKSTQAVIRGLPNAIGIVTKMTRGTAHVDYLEDADLSWFQNHLKVAIRRAVKYAITHNGNVMIPSAGIGTGKAKLAEKAPRVAKHLAEELQKLHNLNKGSK